jgi:hypothetical protein
VSHFPFKVVHAAFAGCTPSFFLASLTSYAPLSFSRHDPTFQRREHRRCADGDAHWLRRSQAQDGHCRKST